MWNAISSTIFRRDDDSIRVSVSIALSSFYTVYGSMTRIHLTVYSVEINYFFMNTLSALGPQYGFTIDQRHDTSHWSRSNSMFAMNSLAVKDYPKNWTNYLSVIPSIFEQSDHGWYWGVLPVLLTGFTIRMMASIAVRFLFLLYYYRWLFLSMKDAVFTNQFSGFVVIWLRLLLRIEPSRSNSR